MKKLTGIMFYLLIMTGCEEKATEVAEIEPVADTETAAETVLLEYMWCDFGPDTNEEAMAALTAEFNEIVNASEYKASSAWGYIPSFETDLYDAIWLNVWADEETRDLGWKEWSENSAEAFQAKYDSVLSCKEDKVFHFNGTAGIEGGEWTAEPPFQAEFSFCTYNEGMNSDNLNTALGKFNSWIDAAAEARGSRSSYFYVMHDPLFDTATADGTAGAYDYAMGAYWQSMEEKEAGYEGWKATNNGLQDEIDAVSTCQIFSMDGYPIMMPTS
ncbi:MAG: hypothetical protein CMK41_05290 [Porticoccaceae bacterium]|nr:hypothetical protein [Porticoccaceae bacterium]